MATLPKSVSTSQEMKLFNRHLEKVAEKTLFAVPVLYELSDKHPLPLHAGKTIFIPRHIAKNRVRALTEGAIIGTCATSAHYYSATVGQYGDATSYTDFLIDIHEIPAMVSNDIEAMSMYSGQKVDSLIGAELSNSGEFVSPDGSTASGAVLATTNLKQRYLFDATATLAGNDVPTYGDGNYATVVHPRGEHDLFVNTSATGQMGQVGSLNDNFMQMTDFGAKKLVNATAGVLGGQRVIRSTHSARLLYHATSDTPSAGAGGMESANCGYQVYSMGPGAVGAIDLGTTRFRTYVKGFPTGGTYDPIEQLMTAGVKFRFAAVKKRISVQGTARTGNSLVRSAVGKTL